MSESKIRLQFDVSSEMLKKIDGACKAQGGISRAELFRRSIHLFSKIQEFSRNDEAEIFIKLPERDVYYKLLLF